jgi:BirA family transcriptional regulator, biotin operon repressor / biotin---[acetyl-CoA-carboxylase] ligase
MAFSAFLDPLLARWEQEREQEEPRNLIVLRRVDSTQDLARRLIRDYKGQCNEIPPVAIVAYRQTVGRGRQGHTWESPGGSGAYVTLVRRISGAESLRQIPLAVAVALAETLDAVLDRPCGLRWPNDLMVEGRKIGGILVDAVSRNSGGPLVLIGFGVNHDHAPLPGIATNVRAHCADPPSLTTLMERMVRSVDASLERLDDGDDLLRRYAAGSVHRPGERLRCRLGEQVKVGVFRGFAAGGFLRLETEDGIELLTAGAVEPPKENA